MTHASIAAVVVAFNRATMLRDTLDALAAQTRRLDDVIVVDNASSDESAQVARGHRVVTDVVPMERNIGGAGGFAVGIARAIARGAEFVWLMDDDTVPSPTALAELCRAHRDYPGQPAVLACRADWIDGREHPMNTLRERFLVDPLLRRRAAIAGARQIRTASFVAILIDARAIREEGLPVADYFLWNDDFEYTARLLRRRVGLYVDAARVEHRTNAFANSTDVDPGPRFVNEVRNKVWAFTRSRAFSPVDTLVFGPATALRWIRMIAKSAQRRERLRDLREGIVRGSRTPRPTAEVLWNTPVGRQAAVLEAGAATRIPPRRAQGPVDFAVLLPVWAGDAPEYFERSLRSVGADQTRKASLLLIVADGPVDARINEILSDCQSGAREDLTGGVPVEVVRIAENRGLANALNKGLEACPYEVVARVDADDVSLPHRFAMQLPLIEEGFELIGSAIAEFDADEAETGLVRRMPLEAREIRETITVRDPFNHPTVVYTKSAVAKAGGYEHVDRMEDYWLFARMVLGGAACCNIQQPLVLYRIGDGAYTRRGGASMFRSEMALQRLLVERGLIGPLRWARNVAVRGGYRLVPASLRKALYQNVGRIVWFR
ncbi:glycosyltransferase [Schaalia hyovaginalis]|uniref:GT2 family glycosyltransferase n=1 Tax=Schaalia hyovaginalis TaxID=29316 RepID=A0A923E1U7_9ACTO|nr:glycosyltransferase [Schaalia hyovaginalis]MBB6334314.1 GT2 family glycosyltransferase [Schaalia hyovaginalis]MDY2668827.1 glycosyltransferase [Schaalia hyovaginalis]